MDFALNDAYLIMGLVVGFVTIYMQVLTRRDVVRARREMTAKLVETDIKVDQAAAHIAIVEQATNHLMDNAIAAKGIVERAAGVAEGIAQTDLVKTVAVAAALVLSDAAAAAAVLASNPPAPIPPPHP